jgi:DNA (cytosine-5)-methyltransferase 1
VKAISLFSGAGGLDVGCEEAGFETVAVVESNPTAVQTMLANRPRWFAELDADAVFDDVVGLEPPELLARAGLDRGDADLLHGGPPCTPFSKSGYWLEYKRAGADPKASLLDSYVEILAAVQPKAFLMENVYGLAYRNQNRARSRERSQVRRRGTRRVDARIRDGRGAVHPGDHTFVADSGYPMPTCGGCRSTA